MKVRDRIAADLSDIEKDLDFYQEANEEGDYDEKLAALAAYKERLLEKADHYDREQAAGYLHPTTHRWRK